MSIPQWRVTGPSLFFSTPPLTIWGESGHKTMRQGEMRYGLKVVEWFSDGTYSLSGSGKP